MRVSNRKLILVVLEHLLIIGVVAFAAWLRLGDAAILGLGDGYLISRAIIVAIVLQVCLYYNDLYDLSRIRDRRDHFTRIVQALGIASIILALVYYLLPDLIIGHGVAVLGTLMIVGLVIGWRVLFEWLAVNVAPRERLLLVGTSAAAVGLARELIDRRPEFGVEIVGFVDTDPAKVGTPIVNPGVIGTIDDIPRIVHEQEVDRVVVSLGDARGKLPMDELLEMKLKAGVRFDHLASVYEEYTGKIAVENLRPSWLIFSSDFRKSRLQRGCKRAFDVVGAALLLVVTLPLAILVAILVWLTSHGPALYHQERVGQHGQPFIIHKFRTMRNDAEKQTGAVWARPDDPRITRVGRFLRRTRLDELPQLWNVLRGEMSFVGPRPERPEFVRQLTREIPFYGQRHVVKPGVTGWAQVRYTYCASVEDAFEKLQYDLFYIKHLSFAFDLFVLFATVKVVVLRRGL